MCFSELKYSWPDSVAQVDQSIISAIDRSRRSLGCRMLHERSRMPEEAEGNGER
jgi:hypothetical protein